MRRNRFWSIIFCAWSLASPFPRASAPGRCRVRGRSGGVHVQLLICPRQLDARGPSLGLLDRRLPRRIPLGAVLEEMLFRSTVMAACITLGHAIR